MLLSSRLVLILSRTTVVRRVWLLMTPSQNCKHSHQCHAAVLHEQVHPMRTQLSKTARLANRPATTANIPHKLDRSVKLPNRAGPRKHVHYCYSTPVKLTLKTRQTSSFCLELATLNTLSKVGFQPYCGFCLALFSLYA